MMQASYIPGLPRRMGAALSALFARDGYRKHREKLSLIDRIQNEPGPLPLDSGDDAIYQAGDESSRACYRHADTFKTTDAILDAIRQECQRRGVPFPQGEKPSEIIARAVDRAWWVRSIRKAHARRFEHTAIQLGFTSYRTGPYISNESAIRQARRNKQNQKLLESVELQNELGQSYTLAQLAALGMGNKALRRGELMTRIRGFEEIAFDLGHMGLFWTITAPSKYHAVISKNGEPNPKYLAFGSPTPRDAQKYLVGVWGMIRAALHRAGIRPYGFRIAEPHHDGCPHWHMLLFVAPEHQELMTAIIRKYALAEDFGEWAKEENRAKLVRIEAGKGTAAGYIAKYVAKNIDGECVGEHHMHENGATYIVAPDLLGKEQITPSQRVTYWSQTWGIRQFQQIGGAPVGVWRELRRIKAETVNRAPEAIQGAWRAAQKVDDVQASWSDYLKAQGGAAVGRSAAVKLAKRGTIVEGRYATYEAFTPCGVFHAANANAVYESVRYQWAQKGVEALAVAVPWTGVNNCTDFNYPALKNRFAAATETLAEGVKNKKFKAPLWVDWREIRENAKAGKKASDKLAAARNKRGPVGGIVAEGEKFTFNRGA